MRPERTRRSGATHGVRPALTPPPAAPAQSVYSNKAFYSEAAIDAHMERRHMDKIPQARAAAAQFATP